METIFLEVLNLSITASWLVLAVLVMRLILRKSPKWINCLLWLVVGIRLVCPFSIESALSLIPSAETIPTTITTSPNPEITSGIEAVDRVVNPVITETFSPEPLVSANPLQIITYVASIVWIIGIVAMISYMVISYIRLKLKIRTSTLLQDNIYQSEFIKSPFVMGIIKPKIYIPYNIATESIDKIILHEQAHLKRHDNIIKPVAFLILSIYWFNPVMWLAFVFLCKDIELACDEKVVKSMTKEDKQDYAKTILENSTKDFLVVACPFSFGDGSIKSRIKNIMTHKRPAIWLIVCSLVLCVTLLICFLTVPKNYGKFYSSDWSYGDDDSWFAIEIEVGFRYERIEVKSLTGNFRIPDIAWLPEKGTYTNEQLICYIPPTENDIDDIIEIKAYVTDDLVYSATIEIYYLGLGPADSYDKTERHFKGVMTKSDGLYLTDPYFESSSYATRLEIEEDSKNAGKIVAYPPEITEW